VRSPAGWMRASCRAPPGRGSVVRMAVAASTGWRAFPVLEGIRPVDRGRLSGDVVAGVTLAALAIPEVMGYTTLAGMPVVTGLYTILLPLAVFAVLGSSRHLVVPRHGRRRCGGVPARGHGR
jgi:hypothetical protein